MLYQLELSNHLVMEAHSSSVLSYGFMAITMSIREFDPLFKKADRKHKYLR